MEDSIQDYAKIGIVHFMAYPACSGGDGPIVETIAALATDPLFDVIEVTRINDPDVRVKVRAVAEENGVDLCFGAQPILLGGGFDLNHPEDDKRIKAINAVKNGIDQTSELGAKGVAVLSGKVSPDKSAAMARLADSLCQLAGHARELGLPLVLETFDQVPYGKNCLIGPTSDAVAISEEVRREFPDFGLMLDLSHLPLQGETSDRGLRTAGEHLVHAHMGNCAMDDPNHPAYGDNHPRFGAPGTRNDVPELAEYLKVLLDTGYLSKKNRRVLSFEVKPMPGESSEEIVEESKRKLEEAWKLV
jgi:sugar phosphate isomerase/epimerase